MDELYLLRAREEEVSREWAALLDAVQQACEAMEKGEHGAPFRLLYDHVSQVGQRRSELWQQMAELESAQAMHA